MVLFISPSKLIYQGDCNMKNKLFVTVLFVVLALPIPISLITILGSIISIANIGMAENNLSVVIPIITMLLAATYTITYIISLLITIKNKKINMCSFFPIMHLVVTALFFFIWANL